MIKQNPFSRSIVLVGLILLMLVSCSELPQNLDLSELSANTAVSTQVDITATEVPAAQDAAGSQADITTTEVPTADAAAGSQADIKPSEDPLVQAAISGTLEEIYARVSPAVVHVQVVLMGDSTAAGSTTTPEFPGLPDLPQSDTPLYGEGSGFVWDKEGHIVTNNHVIEGADKIAVIFDDGRMADASVVGTDPDSDLAVLSIDVPAEYLQPVTLADSTQVKVGDLAIAIGNPFGQEGTMTTGIVSALGRLLPVESSSSTASQYNIPDVIQTDAAINPGNSGGVLLNDQGDVVGVTSAIISAVRSSSGVGFAIPSSIVQDVVPALITNGHFAHPYIGISGTSLTPDLAEAMNLASDQRGALVIEVMPDSPAALAGLLGSDQQVEIDGEQAPVGGDVITAVDEQPVQRVDDLIAYLYRYGQVGNDLSIKILRDGSEQTLAVTLQARPQAESQPTSQSTTNEGSESRAYVGITGIDMTSDLAVLMGLSPDQDGVLVQQVQSGSPAELAGLHASTTPATINGEQALVGGDLIIAANGEAIHNFEDLRSFVDQGAPGDQVQLTILRDGSEQEILLTLGEAVN